MNSELDFASSRNWDDEFYEDELESFQNQSQYPTIEVSFFLGDTLQLSGNIPIQKERKLRLRFYCLETKQVQ